MLAEPWQPAPRRLTYSTVNGAAPCRAIGHPAERASNLSRRLSVRVAAVPVSLSCHEATAGLALRRRERQHGRRSFLRPARQRECPAVRDGDPTRDREAKPRAARLARARF